MASECCSQGRYFFQAEFANHLRLKKNNPFNTLYSSSQLKNLLFVLFCFLSFQVTLAFAKYSEIFRENACEGSEIFKDKESLSSVNT